MSEGSPVTEQHIQLSRVCLQLSTITARHFYLSLSLKDLQGAFSQDTARPKDNLNTVLHTHTMHSLFLQVKLEDKLLSTPWPLRLGLVLTTPLILINTISACPTPSQDLKLHAILSRKRISPVLRNALFKF